MYTLGRGSVSFSIFSISDSSAELVCLNYSIKLSWMHSSEQFPSCHYTLNWFMGPNFVSSQCGESPGVAWPATAPLKKGPLGHQLREFVDFKICPDSIRFPTPKISQNTVSAQIAKKATCGYSGIRIQIQEWVAGWAVSSALVHWLLLPCFI